MTASSRFALPAPGGGTLQGLVDLPDLPGERPTVVLCHGVPGLLEWGFFPPLADLLAARGFVAVRAERGDLPAVLAALAPGHQDGSGIAPGRVDRTRIGLYGHGEGAGDALLAAASSPGPRVRALVTWSTTWSTVLSIPLAAAAARRTTPWLLVHGEADATVPVETARRLAAAAAPPAELLVVPDAGHTFGARHPFAGPTPQLIQALNATQRWFRRHV